MPCSNCKWKNIISKWQMACFQTVLSPRNLSNSRILGNNVPMVMDICFHGIQKIPCKFCTIHIKKPQTFLSSSTLLFNPPEMHWCCIQFLYCPHPCNTLYKNLEMFLLQTCFSSDLLIQWSGHSAWGCTGQRDQSNPEAARVPAERQRTELHSDHKLSQRVMQSLPKAVFLTWNGCGES